MRWLLLSVMAFSGACDCASARQASEEGTSGQAASLAEAEVEEQVEDGVAEAAAEALPRGPCVETGRSTREWAGRYARSLHVVFDSAGGLVIRKRFGDEVAFAHPLSAAGVLDEGAFNLGELRAPQLYRVAGGFVMFHFGACAAGEGRCRLARALAADGRPLGDAVELGGPSHDLDTWEVRSRGAQVHVARTDGGGVVFERVGIVDGASSREEVGRLPVSRIWDFALDGAQWAAVDAPPDSPVLLLTASGRFEVPVALPPDARLLLGLSPAGAELVWRRPEGAPRVIRLDLEGTVVAAERELPPDAPIAGNGIEWVRSVVDDRSFLQRHDALGRVLGEEVPLDADGSPQYAGDGRSLVVLYRLREQLTVVHYRCGA